jgi:hypothetical protein
MNVVFLKIDESNTIRESLGIGEKIDLLWDGSLTLKSS